METEQELKRLQQEAIDANAALEKIDQVRGLVDKDMEKYIELLYNVIMKMSRAHQKEIV